MTSFFGCEGMFSAWLPFFFFFFFLSFPFLARLRLGK